MWGRGARSEEQAKEEERESRSVHLIGGDVKRTRQSNASDGLKLLALSKSVRPPLG